MQKFNNHIKILKIQFRWYSRIVNSYISSEIMTYSKQKITNAISISSIVFKSFIFLLNKPLNSPFTFLTCAFRIKQRYWFILLLRELAFHRTWRLPEYLFHNLPASKRSLNKVSRLGLIRSASTKSKSEISLAKLVWVPSRRHSRLQ